MEKKQRKHPRLKNYDYSLAGCYFITVCVKNMENILSSVEIVGRDAYIPPRVILTETGKIVDYYINNIDAVYNNVIVRKYVIMPNHIHLLIEIRDADNTGGMWASRPTIPGVVRSLKTMITKQLGYSIWQASFYDHIIRSDAEYKRIWNYIEQNPLKWEQDIYNN